MSTDEELNAEIDDIENNENSCEIQKNRFIQIKIRLFKKTV